MQQDSEECSEFLMLLRRGFQKNVNSFCLKLKRFMFQVDKHFKNLYKEHNCHPLRSLGLGLVQAVPWVTFSMALRNIAFMLPDNVPGKFCLLLTSV